MVRWMMLVAACFALVACGSDSSSSIAEQANASVVGLWESREEQKLFVNGADATITLMQIDVDGDGDFTQTVEYEVRENGSSAIFRQILDGEWQKSGSQLVVSDGVSRREIVKIDASENDQATVEALVEQKNLRNSASPRDISYDIEELGSTKLTLRQVSEVMTLQRLN